MTVAVVLAGGFGTRLRSAVSDVPKPMAPVRGRPFLTHLFDYWKTQGVSRFVLSVGYKHEVIQAYFGHSYHGTPIDYVVEDAPLGTGGALLLCAKNMTSDFLLLNGDTFFAIELQELARRHLISRSEFTMGVFESSDIQRYTPLDVDAGGRILALKASKAESCSWVNGGVSMIHPSLLQLPAPQHRPMSFEGDWLPALLGSGLNANVMFSAGTFIDIGVPSDYFNAEKVLP